MAQKGKRALEQTKEPEPKRGRSSAPQDSLAAISPEALKEKIDTRVDCIISLLKKKRSASALLHKILTAFHREERIGSRVLVAVHRPEVKYVLTAVLKRKHLGEECFKELVADPGRYNNSNPFDDTEAVWLETPAAQKLRRYITEGIRKDARRHSSGSRAIFDREIVMFLNVNAPVDFDRGDSEDEEDDS
jgi:hypothetical protein